MALSRKKLIALVLLAAIPIVVAVFAPMLLGPLVFRAVATPTVIRSDHPLSPAEVKGINFPFPATATNIQFALYQEWIAYDFVVRFEASKDDCLATVPKAVDAYHSSLLTADAVAELRTIKSLTRDRDHLRQVADFQVPWFDPENIQEGVEAGGRGSHVPKIWIDTARGIFYFQYTD